MHYIHLIAIHIFIRRQLFLVIKLYFVSDYPILYLNPRFISYINLSKIINSLYYLDYFYLSSIDHFLIILINCLKFLSIL